MAAKRMFSIDVIDTDKFLDMPVSTQALYFHFGMRADDDGFVSSPKKIVKIANCTNDDLRILISKGYVIPFDSGVVVITDWRVNNSIRSDRYKPTIYQEELKQLETSKNTYLRGSVGIPIDNQCVTREQPEWNQNGYQMDTQVRLDKDRTNNLSILDAKSKKITPTLEEIRIFAEQEGIHIDTQKFYDYYTGTGWKTKNGQLIKDWRKTLKHWGKTEGTPHKGTKQQDPPVSENAEAYASLIYNLNEPI